jgi:hypothetical protein
MLNYNTLKPILVCIAFAFVQMAVAQSNIVYLIGKGRHCGDSVVLRWNAEDVFSFGQLINSTVHIERKTEADINFIPIAKQSAVPVQNWSINQETKNQLLLLAAASLQQLSNTAKEEPKELSSQLELMENRNFFWVNTSLAADLNPNIASLCNLRFVDHKASQYKDVQYKIYIESNSFISDTLFIFLEGGKEMYRNDQCTLSAAEGESSIRFDWVADKSYSAYYIQKSSNNGASYQTLNSSPLVIPANQGDKPILFWTDSTQNYQANNYRVIAIDLFGDTAMVSKPVKAMGRDKTAPPMVTGFKVKETSGVLNLTWDAVDALSGEKGIAIGVKNSSEARYEPLHKTLLPSKTRSFEYKPSTQEKDYYFILQLFDTAGNSSKTEVYCQLEDNVPPAKPIKLRATVDTNGVVCVRWNKNLEKDLNGYLIYFSNSETSEFSGIVNTPYPDTVFYDTLSLRMLNREVFYRIVAADNRFNLSASSDIVKVLRPDTLKPVSPLIRDYQISDSCIRLYWLPSSSADVVSHVLLKVDIQNKTQTNIQLKLSDTLFIDKKILGGKQYAYSVRAVDESGNVSPSSMTVVLKTYKNIYLPALKVFVVLYDSVNNTVKLQWQLPEGDKDVLKTVIYKGKVKDSIMPMPSDLKKGNLVFYDKSVDRGMVYFYSIKVYFVDGSQTLITSPIGVFTN